MGSATMPRLTGEVIGTAMLVFFGVSGLVTSGGQAFFGAVSFLVTAAVVYWIFGGHFNPWITLATAIKGSLDWLGALAIIIAQLIGGIIGGLLLWAVLGSKGVANNLGVTRLSPDVTSMGNKGYISAALAETLAVFVLCCVVFALAGNAMTGIGMGLAYAAGTMAIFVITAASLNFARTLGPYVVMLLADDKAQLPDVKQMLTYLLSGLLGAALAGLLYPVWRPEATPVKG
jgi:glycerol uptake facilitator-like aquaporin